jgi:hypothetical protein
LVTGEFLMKQMAVVIDSLFFLSISFINMYAMQQPQDPLAKIQLSPEWKETSKTLTVSSEEPLFQPIQASFYLLSNPIPIYCFDLYKDLINLRQTTRVLQFKLSEFNVCKYEQTNNFITLTIGQVGQGFCISIQKRSLLQPYNFDHYWYCTIKKKSLSAMIGSVLEQELLLILLLKRLYRTQQLPVLCDKCGTLVCDFSQKNIFSYHYITLLSCGHLCHTRCLPIQHSSCPLCNPHTLVKDAQITSQQKYQDLTLENFLF